MQVLDFAYVWQIFPLLLNTSYGSAFVMQTIPVTSIQSRKIGRIGEAQRLAESGLGCG